jgi:histidinol dehydrogenase
MAHRLNAAAPGFEADLDALIAQRGETTGDISADVAQIIDGVRAGGDARLLEYAEKFDRTQVDRVAALRVSEKEIKDARAACSDDMIAALKLAHGRIRDFHSRQMPASIDYTDDAGVRLGARWTPIAHVGIYVPGGTASYPSSVLMNAVPAQVAGVDRIAMAVPSPDGVLNPLVLAAADIAGVSEIWRMGGAQAIAALAYGTETIAAVDKITGPGNAWVAEAKRQVFGQVGIDMIAGPSEILVVADNINDPDWIAADLMSQAEHDVAAQAVLITDDQDFADKVAAAVETMLADLPREAVARASWQTHGLIILVPTLGDAAAVIDRIAPEHLELAVDAPAKIADQVRHAGAIFMGRHTPEAIGDYVAGPNHVLPTSRSARFSSGLGVTDFLKRTTTVACDAESLAAIGPAAVTLAGAEGLDAHGRSVSIRLNSGDDC